MKILVVDDSKVARKVVSDEILELGHEVVEACTGNEALEILKRETVDLITLDVEMPGLTGYETCQEIRKREILNINEFIPIVFFTSKDTPKERLKGFEAGATDFVAKSMQPKDLKNTIKRLLTPETRWVGLKAMVVDKAELSRNMIKSILSGMGLDVITANSGDEAFKLMSVNPDEFDLVVTDQYLEELNGIELCSKIRNELDQKSLPIIFISYEPDRQNVLNYFKNGASDYLPKPFFKEEFCARLNTHLDLRLFYRNLDDKVKYLKQLDQMKNKFLTVCSHDLRSPLNAILGFAQLLDHTTLEADQKECVHQISQAGQYLNDLISELLDLSKMDMLDTVVEKEKIDLSKIIQKCMKSFSQILGTKNIKISLNQSSVEKYCLDGNDMALTRIINNLLSNAIKFTNKNGAIDIILKNIDGKKIEFTVKDDGVGIPKDKISLLFNKFTKASRVGTEGEASHGLGLSIVKDLVEQHNGKIDVSSIESEGASFVVLLPIAT